MEIGANIFMWFSNNTSPIPLDLAPTNRESPTLMVLGFKTILRQKGLLILVPKQSQNKPFENKWSRFSSATAAAAPSSQKSDKQAQTTNHTCTESCRSIIVGDFKHEKPLWKLTCYGHWKNSPCDIAGDISYEELRAAAARTATLLS
ncbi:hypothetical protein ACFX2A_041413 [Malus domestica]